MPYARHGVTVFQALDADEGGGDYLSLGRDSVCMEMGVIKGWADQEKKGTQSLCRLLSSLTVSDSEELLRILRYVLRHGITSYDNRHPITMH